MQKVQAHASVGNTLRTYNFAAVSRPATGIPAIVLSCLIAAVPAAANSASMVLRAKGASEIYNLDRDRAVESFRQAVAADPKDAAAYRGLASALWLSITFRRGNMTVDDYLGNVSRSNSPAPPPPADVAAAFNDALEHALAIARSRRSSRRWPPTRRMPGRIAASPARCGSASPSAAAT